MSDVTIWMGPVSNAQVAPCFIPGGYFPPAFSCRNPYLAPIPTCQQMIASFDRGGRYLPAMLGSRKIPLTDVSRLFIGSFSAGHGALKDRILMSPQDREMITSVFLSDSTYTDWIGDNPKLGPRPRAGYVSFMQDCLREPKLFVATSGASTPMDSLGKPMPSSAQSMWALATELERVSGRKFEPFDASWSVPPPEKAAIMKGDNGGVIVLMDYGSRVSHEKQPTVIAPQVWNKVVLPWAQVGRCGEAIAMQGFGAAGSCPLPPKTEPFPPGLAPDPSEPGFMEEEKPSVVDPDHRRSEQAAAGGLPALIVSAVLAFWLTSRTLKKAH